MAHALADGELLPHLDEVVVPVSNFNDTIDVCLLPNDVIHT
jgi:hypothetical protein